VVNLQEASQVSAISLLLEKLMSDPSKSKRVVDAFLQMKKFEIDKLII
jgi:predicted 3-demethylubiquinone-9 3-methyltransferase (glyoxalase superfamily)